MKTYKRIFLGCVLLSFLGSCSTNQKKDTLSAILEHQIDSMRIAYDFPAISYGVIRNDSILVLNTVGYRDIETKEKAQPTDYFHVGSNTKSFTAFLAGKLVDDSLIEWDTKFFDLYPELKNESNQAYFDITLQQLLSHRARLNGFHADSDIYPIITEYEKTLNDNLTLQEKRYFLIKHILKLEPSPPSYKYEHSYSNAGIIAAGLMLEKVMGKSWEKLIMELSSDLDLEIHIGWPNEYNKNQPKGHIDPKIWGFDFDKDLIPLPEVFKQYHFFHQFGLLTTPSGNISITLNSFLEYLRLHIKGFNGEDNYLNSDTYKHIFTTYPKYSHGWFVDEIGKVTEYSHRGTNGTFCSFAVVIPEKNLGIVVMINTHNETGLTDIIQQIMKVI